MREPTRLRVLAGALLISSLALASCRDTGGDEDYFAISGKLFEFNYRLAIATYVVTLQPLRKMEEGHMAVVSFENPAGGEPIVVEQKIWPKLPHVTLTSPPLSCVAKDRPYAVSISIEAPDGTVEQTLDTTITSSLDQSVLPDRPLVTGPIYTLNPELAGHPDGRLPDTKAPACPPKT